MSDSAFFKVKSSKRSNPEARTTLDAIHNQKVQTMLEEKDNIVKYKGCTVLETVANTYVALTLKGWINSGFKTASQATITHLIYKA